MNEFKYIIIESVIKRDEEGNENKVLIPIIFPKFISHDHMFESTRHLLGMKHRWRDSKAISAGFIYLSTLSCHGYSETLELHSRGEEDSLIIKAYSMLAHV